MVAVHPASFHAPVALEQKSDEKQKTEAKSWQFRIYKAAVLLVSPIATPISNFFTDWIHEMPQNGMIGDRQLHPSLRIVYVNGILTSSEECQREAGIISRIFNDSRVHYTYSPSGGVYGDIKRMANALFRGVTLVAAQQLATNIKERIKDLNENSTGFNSTDFNSTDFGDRRVIVMCHSGGGILMKIACSVLLSEEERKMVAVYSFGSAVIFSDKTVSHAVNYVSRSDYVPSFCTLIQGYFWSNPGPIVKLGSAWRSPLAAHCMAGREYVDAIEMARDDVQKKILKLSQTTLAANKYSPT